MLDVRCSLVCVTTYLGNNNMPITPCRPAWKGTMTARERFNRQMHYQSVDRCFNMEFGYWEENFHQWPLFWRILLLPVSMVLAPVAWLMALWELRRSLPLPVLFVLGLFAPVAVMFVPFVVMGPRRYVDPFMAFVQRWTVPFFEGAEQEQAVSDLLSDALGREPRRRV